MAFANPLDDAALTVVGAALHGPIRVVVTTRRAIEVAQRRVYASKSIGERLLQTGVITQDQLQRALRVHDRAGVRIGKALVNLGFVAEDELAVALAEQAGLPFYDLAGVEPDREIAQLLPMDLERERGILPILDDGDAIVVACADLPEACGVEDAEARIGRRLQPVIVTESSFDAALDLLYRDEYLEHSTAYLVSRSPEDSGKWVLSHGQKVFFMGLLLTTVIGLVLAPSWTVTFFFSLSTLFYVAFANYKFYLAYRGVTHQFEVETTPEELAAIDDRLLPVYTILVPVYRETEVFSILARAIERLDYPKASST